MYEYVMYHQARDGDDDDDGDENGYDYRCDAVFTQEAKSDCIVVVRVSVIVMLLISGACAGAALAIYCRIARAPYPQKATQASAMKSLSDRVTEMGMEARGVRGRTKLGTTSAAIENATILI